MHNIADANGTPAVSLHQPHRPPSARLRSASSEKRAGRRPVSAASRDARPLPPASQPSSVDIDAHAVPDTLYSSASGGGSADVRAVGGAYQPPPPVDTAQAYQRRGPGRTYAMSYMPSPARAVLLPQKLAAGSSHVVRARDIAAQRGAASVWAAAEACHDDVMHVLQDVFRHSLDDAALEVSCMLSGDQELPSWMLQRFQGRNTLW
ncbi:MAG: hypothetical protein EOO41_05905 [Methanobacteriota archaeon]|nr:MAG: hypothetical protein EOO41_05905 [Euryarchaeota archaeon]